MAPTKCTELFVGRGVFFALAPSSGFGYASLTERQGCRPWHVFRLAQSECLVVF
ncbi:hypothetical protein FA10DRAFT_269441 [Acaromyces ingoldii]|uniref:Uncharacterized protein n=1 Tax=Acaromyces ingoldii TaxID=215250 RepID=A0A316YDJ7_9BASI|nr:hypothetical protein FA10DRAFT_269441 [Acaromyces ingoldii]PWN87487.1 hypothetical protein FA10DRAFT_269441 [Acaromyces ingoldii]